MAPEREGAHAQDPAQRAARPTTERPATAVPHGLLTARTLAGLGVSAGNRAVQRLVRERSAPGVPVQRWTMPLLTRKSQEELIRDGIAGDTNAIGEVTDFTAVSDDDRLAMVDHLLDQVYVGPLDSRALERLWTSFGTRFSQVASAHLELWHRSAVRHTGLPDNVAPAAALRRAFVTDVTSTARGYLRTNKQFAHDEMARFGIPQDASAAAAPLTQDQAGQIARLQVAAEGLGKLQLAMEASRTVPVGFELTGGSEFSRNWRRARFDPDGRPPLTQIPRETGITEYVLDESREEYIPVVPRVSGDDLDEWQAAHARVAEATSLKPYADVKAGHTAAAAGAQAYLTRFPDLFVAYSQGATATGALAQAPDPAAARQQLGEGFRRLIAKIDESDRKLGNDLDPLDLTPIHDRLYSGDAPGVSRVDWSDALPREVASSQVRDHNVSRALRQLLLAELAQLAFLVAPFGGIAGAAAAVVATGATGTNLVMDATRFQALSAAAQTSATPGTDLVRPQAVDEARMAVEADALAFGLALLALGGAARAALDRIRNPAGVQAAATEARAAAARAQAIQEATAVARSEVTTLTNAGAEMPAGTALAKYEVGAGFSGAYEPTTGKWVAVASGDAKLLSGEPIATVPRFGGHAAAEASLVQRSGITDTSKNVGFVLVWEGEGTLNIRWNSGTINGRNFGSPAAPAPMRPAIRAAVEATTGCRVVE